MDSSEKFQLAAGWKCGTGSSALQRWLTVTGRRFLRRVEAVELSKTCFEVNKVTTKRKQKSKNKFRAPSKT